MWLGLLFRVMGRVGVRRIAFELSYLLHFFLSSSGEIPGTFLGLFFFIVFSFLFPVIIERDPVSSLVRFFSHRSYAICLF